MQVGVKHPGSLAAFSVVVSRPREPSAGYLVPRITRRLVPVVRAADSWATLAGPGPGGQPRPPYAGRRPGVVTWPYAAGRVATATRRFACYVWDPVTTAGAAGAVQARRRPGSVVRVLIWPPRPSPLSARPGRASRRRGRRGLARAGLCLSLLRSRACSLPHLSIHCAAPAVPGRGPGPGLRPSGVACARNREGAAGLPLGMSNNA
jgi:hypothetical protein